MNVDHNLTIDLSYFSPQDGDGVLVVDAGGGTIDVSGYRQISNQSFEEISTPECTIKTTPCTMV